MLNKMPTTNKKIIAVVGMCGSGKSVVSDFLQERGYNYLRFDQIVLDEVKKINSGLKSNEKLEKSIREGYRKKYGMAAFAILNKPKIDELLEKGNVVIDGLYSWSEYKSLKENYGDSLKILAVIASPEIRYGRLEKRTIIDEKMKNRPIKKEDAKLRDYSEIENIEKAGPIAMADYYVLNNGSKEELINKLEEIFRE